jgi:hypothetical protein
MWIGSESIPISFIKIAILVSQFDENTKKPLLTASPL